MKELGVEEDRVLKCNAHIILAIDDAIDYVLKDMELKIGRDKLAGELCLSKFKCKAKSNLRRIRDSGI